MKQGKDRKMERKKMKQETFARFFVSVLDWYVLWVIYKFESTSDRFFHETYVKIWKFKVKFKLN